MRLSRAKRKTSSLALRLLTKQIVRSPRAVSAASSPAASPSADPRVPSASSSSGVSQNATRRGARGAPSSVDDAHVEAGERGAGLRGVRDRGAGEQELRLAAVERAHAPQPPQHERHVRAEDAAVGVRLVDHDVREVGQHVRPAPVVGQDADVQHVGVRQDRIGEAAHEVALLARRVAVVDRRAAGRGRTRAARAPDPARAPWSGRCRARAPTSARTPPPARAG